MAPVLILRASDNTAQSLRAALAIGSQLSLGLDVPTSPAERRSPGLQDGKEQSREWCLLLLVCAPGWRLAGPAIFISGTSGQSGRPFTSAGIMGRVASVAITGTLPGAVPCYSRHLRTARPRRREDAPNAPTRWGLLFGRDYTGG
jgi:hypothetical protein